MAAMICLPDRNGFSNIVTVSQAVGDDCVQRGTAIRLGEELFQEIAQAGAPEKHEEAPKRRGRPAKAD